ncbi:hypothetical protein EC973_000714 [Apophysomyces ossiformis]|uniref:Pre-mRNA-splicing factor CWC24 n=1 Tax=Apophysomyces ossiformis TaxID=679940 RepID=A0A8H7EP31_9FUNG|nr:hypothetical protein EC973_000714 [Apophysomyces ossiformis]
MADTTENEPIVSLTSETDNVSFFKKRATKKTIRKRKQPVERKDSDDDDANEDDLVSEVVTKDRKSAATPFVQSTRKKKSRHTEDNEEEDHGIGVHYAADRSASTQRDDATRYATEWELEKEAMEKVKRAVESGKAASLSAADIKPKKKDVANSKMQVGPQRAPANLRVTARFDYQPDVCKDYKETGFCGFGDSCIFLHDRGDYKTGWQLEQEWEEAQKNKKRFGQSNPDEYAVSDEEEEELPFACLLCRKEFDNPVVTKCGHYFCERCAINQFKKSPKCYACGASTGGVFDTAKNLLAKLAEKKARLEEDEPEFGDTDAIDLGDNNEDDDDDDDD